MKRKVECQVREERIIAGRGPTPDTGEVAPDVEKPDVVVVFYDTESLAHRNVYQVFLTPEEATKYEVGKVYTLTIE